MKKRAFVIGDVHGMYQMLVQLLKEWDPIEEQLVFVGDLIDRGPQISEVLDLVIDLQVKHDAWVITGNHEAMLLDFLNNPLEGWERYRRNGGKDTLKAINQLSDQEIDKLGLPELVKLTKSNNPWLMAWLKELPLYIEYGSWILVHAGVNLNISDWHDTDEADYYWIRESFHQSMNNSGKKIIFGHTPLMHLNLQNNDLAVWHHQGKYGIDGGAVHGGDLIALHIQYDGQVIGESRVTQDI